VRRKSGKELEDGRDRMIHRGKTIFGGQHRVSRGPLDRVPIGTRVLKKSSAASLCCPMPACRRVGFPR